MAGTDLDRAKSTAPTATGVSPADEPSAEWGWHGEFKLGTPLAGILVGLSMFAMLIGNHQGVTEDLWLIAVGLLCIGGSAWLLNKRRTSWRR